MTQQDFASIRQLRHRKMVDTAMQKHGLKSASKRARAHDKAEEAAEEMMALQVNLCWGGEEKWFCLFMGCGGEVYKYASVLTSLHVVGVSVDHLPSEGQNVSLALHRCRQIWV